MIHQTPPTKKPSNGRISKSLLLSKILLFSTVIITIPLFLSMAPQEVRVNQKKIEREHAKKQKQAEEAYKQAVRRHNKMQSKTTKASMKKTKKESGKTPPYTH